MDLQYGGVRDGYFCIFTARGRYCFHRGLSVHREEGTWARSGWGDSPPPPHHHGLDGGTPPPCPGLDVDTHLLDLMGVPPSIRDWMGVTPTPGGYWMGDRAAEWVLATWQAVCHLHSHRRTSFCPTPVCNPMVWLAVSSEIFCSTAFQAYLKRDTTLFSIQGGVYNLINLQSRVYNLI